MTKALLLLPFLVVLQQHAAWAQDIHPPPIAIKPTDFAISLPPSTDNNNNGTNNMVSNGQILLKTVFSDLMTDIENIVDVLSDLKNLSSTTPPPKETQTSSSSDSDLDLDPNNNDDDSREALDLFNSTKNESSALEDIFFSNDSMQS